MVVAGQLAPPGTQELEFCDQVPLLQEKLQAPVNPPVQEPALPPLGVAGRVQLLMVVAKQLPPAGTHTPPESVNPALQVNSHFVAVQAATKVLGVLTNKPEASPAQSVALAGSDPVQRNAGGVQVFESRFQIESLQLYWHAPV